MEKLGLSANRIARTVRAQRAYDGPASTLNTIAAGIQPRRGLFADMSVQELFTEVLSPNAAVSAAYATGRGATLNDVYYAYGRIKAEVILHEALHAFFGSTYPDDYSLAMKLGVSDEDYKTKGSHSISDALKNAGCG